MIPAVWDKRRPATTQRCFWTKGIRGFWRNKASRMTITSIFFLGWGTGQRARETIKTIHAEAWCLCAPDTNRENRSAKICGKALMNKNGCTMAKNISAWFWCVCVFLKCVCARWRAVAVAVEAFTLRGSHAQQESKLWGLHEYVCVRVWVCACPCVRVYRYIYMTHGHFFFCLFVLFFYIFTKKKSKHDIFRQQDHRIAS